MASFTDLVKSQEFAQSSQPKRKQMFDDWKSTNLDPILAEQPAATRIQADQKLQQVFDRISPAPEGEFFGDIGTSFSAGVDTAQALTAEVGVQAAELALDVTGREQETPLLRSLDEQLGPDSYLRQYYDRTSNELKQFSLEQQKEAEETKKGLSGLAQDKQITLKELQDATESDGAEAWATAKFYLDPANFDALINLSVESAPSTAVAVGATVAGGLVAGPAGASVAAVATEGALGAGEASMGAYNTAYQELKKQGLTDDEANTEALRISRTAAGIGGAASAVLGKLGDAGAVAKQFGKGATKEAIDEAVKRTVAQKARRGLGVAASAVTPLVGEGLQGAAVQIAENIAVDEVVETPWNEGAITAGVTEALAAGPTTAATAGAGATTRRLGAEIQRRAEERAKDPDVIAAREKEFLEDALEVEIDVAMDRADEILRTQQPTIEIEDELDAQSTADQEKDRQAEAVTLDQELDSTALTGGLDSTGSDLPTEQPTSTDEDTGSPDSTATTNDSQGTAGTQSEDGVLGGGESATAPPTTGPAQQTETTAPGAGDGTATDGQESGPADSTGVNIDQGATPSGSIEQPGSDSASADLVTDARSIPDPENVAVQWDDMLEDVVDGEIVSPELSYADLTEEGKLFWKQAVEDGYGSAARAEEIMRTELRNGTTPRTAPATDVSQYTPQVIQDIRTGTVSDNQTTGATASLTNPNTMPVILDRGTTQPALPVNTVAAPDTLEGAAGAINAAIKASNKQSGKPAQNGSYMIADPANGVAHIMTRAGSLVRTVPFASIDIAAPVHTVNTPDGAVGYQRVQVKKKNQVRKTRNGNPDVYHYDGIAYPTTMDASLKPAGGGFSGIVYIAKDALPENRVAPNIPTGPINANIADQNLTNETVDPDIAEVVNFNRRLPSNIVQMLPNADRGEPATTVGDIIDAMIADATANNDRYYMDVLAKIAPFIRDVKISAKQSAVPEEPNVAGYYSSQEDAIVLSYRNGADYHTITHELVHAATVHAAFYSDSARSRKVREQIEAAFETYKAVAAGTDTANEYGLTNSLEFLSEIFTNPNFKAQLDSVLGTQRRSDMTLYERIVDAIKSLFGLNPSSDFSADNVLEWTMLLFETSRDLARTQPSITSSNRGRSMADVINDRNSVGNNPLTRRNVANAMYWARMNLWAKYVYNNTAEFLTFLNLRTRVPKETEDHDSHRLYQVFKLIPQRVNRIKQSFNDTTFRSINNQVNELAKASDLGMSKRDIHNDAARYAQLKHIANATRVVRNGLQNEIAQANLRIKELQDQQKALRGEIPADETEEQTAERDATAEELANEEIQWLEFRAEQERQATAMDIVQVGGNLFNQTFWQNELDNGATESRKALASEALELYENGEFVLNEPITDKFPNAMQGGATTREAARYMTDIVKRIGTDTLATRQALDAISQEYVLGFRKLWRMGVENGEVSAAEAKHHRDTGLDQDFIGFTGFSEDTGAIEDAANNPFGGNIGAINVGAQKRRKGRDSAPEDAYESLQRAVSNMASRVASRPFKKQLLHEIRTGRIPKSMAGTRVYQSKNENEVPVPKGAVRPISMRDGGNIVQMWIADVKVMDALRNIAEPNHNLVVRTIAKTTQFAARMMVHMDIMFQPINLFRDAVDTALNAPSRAYTDSNGNALDRNVLQAKIATNMMNAPLIADVERLARHRDFTSRVGDISAETRAQQRITRNLEERRNKNRTDEEIVADNIVLSNVDANDTSSPLVMRSRLGRYIIEAEQAGAMQVRLEGAEQIFKGVEGPRQKAVQEAVDKAITSALKGNTRLTKRNLELTLQGLGLPVKSIGAVLDGFSRRFEYRTSVAVYAALREMGVSRQQAAFRTNDIMNYNQRGALTQYLGIIMPFANTIVQGGANTWRSLSNQRGLVQYGAITFASISAILLLQMLAGDEDEDEISYNRWDATDPLTLRGNVPIIVEGSEYSAKVPVPFGVSRLAWTSALQAVRGFQNSDIDTMESGISEIIKVAVEETLPINAELVSKVDGIESGIQVALLHMIPQMARGSVASSMNMNAFGGQIDRSEDRTIEEYAQGTVRTEEFYKDMAYEVEKIFGGTPTPAKLKAIMTSMLPGVGAVILKGNTSGDREAKGLPTNAGRELGYWDIFSLSRLYGKAMPPEERVGYQLQNKVFKDRLEYSNPKRGVKARKAKTARGYLAADSFENTRVWDMARLEADGRLGLVAQAEAADKLSKGLRKISTKVKKAYDKVLTAEQKARIANGDEAGAYAVSIEGLESEREVFEQGYLDQRKLHRQFISEFNVHRRLEE